jgi:hypothetical protein
MTHIEQLHLEAIEESKDHIDTLTGYVWGIKEAAAAKKSAEITENIACDFAKWLDDNYRYCGFGGDEVKKASYKLWFEEYLEYLKTKENEAKIHMVK